MNIKDSIVSEELTLTSCIELQGIRWKGLTWLLLYIFDNVSKTWPKLAACDDFRSGPAFGGKIIYSQKMTVGRGEGWHSSMFWLASHYSGRLTRLNGVPKFLRFLILSAWKKILKTPWKHIIIINIVNLFIERWKEWKRCFSLELWNFITRTLF